MFWVWRIIECCFLYSILETCVFDLLPFAGLYMPQIWLQVYVSSLYCLELLLSMFGQIYILAIFCDANVALGSVFKCTWA